MKRRLSQFFVAGAAAVSFSVIAAGQQGQQAQQQPGMQPGAAAGATQQPGMQVGQHDQQKIKKVQERLSERGHDVGPVDGIMGPQTQQALRDFQEKEGLEKTGQLDQQTLSALGIDEPAAAGATAPGIERDADRAPGAAAGATAPAAQQPGQVGAQQQPEQDRAAVGAGATTPGAQQQEQDRAPGAGAGATAPGTQLEQDRATAGAGAERSEERRN